MKRFIGLIGVGALAACSVPASVGSVSQNIINGVTDSNDAAVVMVLSQVPGSQSASLCTGTVISPHVILTAAHCVDPAVVGTGAKTVVFVGQQLTQTSPSSDFLTVKETHFNTSFDMNNPQNGNDVAVVILVNPTTITPLPYNREAIPQTMVGQPARLVGYGITSGTDTMGTTAGTRRTAPSTLAKLDDLFVGLQDGAHGICEGDSGGPSFMTFNGVERVVGVTSFGFNGCPLTGQQGFEAGNDTRVDTYADFIDMWVRMFDPPASNAGDQCTSDADCIPLQCVQTSVGKICEQSCGPGASSCPANTTCTSVDGSNICVSNSANGGSGGGGGGKGGGCDVGGQAPIGAASLFFACALLLFARRRRS
jgi:secreted trypsin-like serine protease